MAVNRTSLVLPLLVSLALPAAAGSAKRPGSRFAKWSGIEFAFTGPELRGAGDPNPFAIPLDVTFTSPGGRQVRVPGFYDGDGQGGLDGNVWKVRFSADETGTWSYRTTSRDDSLDGKTGQFVVGPVPADARGLWKWGRLEFVGTPGNQMRYLKFRDGPYWLKAGCDDPENFLGKARHYDTLAERRRAVDYLAARGINSLYMMTHNIDGDDNDVWPWLGETPQKAKANAGPDARFDIAKLRQWRQLFEHMQTKGVVPYLVLEDDSAWKRYDHARYYRELIARFGDLPAVLLNFGEEHNENYSLDEALAWMQQLDRIDPYDHPRGIHNVNRPTDAYVDAPYVHFTSIQTQPPDAGRALEGALAHNGLAIRWIDRCRVRGRRVLVVGFDEGRPVQMRQAWWSAYLGGGVWEAHVRKPYDRPMDAWEPVWTALGGARRFMESLPFWNMHPHNELVVAGKAFCLAKPGEAYALYLPNGGRVTVDLTLGRTYECAWWNPVNGKDGRFEGQRPVAGGRQTLAAPGRSDWALRIVRRGRKKGLSIPGKRRPDAALIDGCGSARPMSQAGGRGGIPGRAHVLPPDLVGRQGARVQAHVADQAPVIAAGAVAADEHGRAAAENAVGRGGVRVRLAVRIRTHRLAVPGHGDVMPAFRVHG